MEENKITWPGWEVVRKIGSGSFGAVYEIRRDVFGREEKAALKVLSIPEKPEEIEELYNSGEDDASISTHYKDQLGEIVREYSLMLDLKGHSNVVYCDDLKYIQHDDGIGWDIYIKMELLTPLLKALGKDYDEAQTVRLGIDLCSALVLCRQYNIVHRDIKPQNIFVSQNGDYKLGDFGVAKVSEKTASGTTAGTYEYMAPEVCFGQAYGSGADIYSLGLVLYWMMNRRRTPFQPYTIPTSLEKEAARERRLKGEAIPAPANGSAELQRIVLKACAYDPKERYQTAAEMRQDLKKLDTGAVFIPPVTPEPAPEEPVQATEGTVNIFTGKAVPSVEKTTYIHPDASEEKTEYIREEKTEYIKEEKTAYIPRTEAAPQPAQAEPKKKKGLLPLIIGVAAAAILLVLLLLLRSCGGDTPSVPDHGTTTGSPQGTTQTGATTVPAATTTVPAGTEGTTAPTTVPDDTTAPTTEGTVPSTTQTEPTVPPTTAPPVTQPANATLTGITLAAKPSKTSYYVGDTLNTAGLKLKLTYSDGSSQTTTGGFTCSPTKLSTAGTQKITVTYGGKTATFDVTVTAVAVSKVAIKSNPTKTTYTQGDTLNTAGLSLTVTYNNGTTKTVTGGFTCSPTTLSTVGTQTVTVTYEGKTATFAVTVLEIVSSGSCGDNLTYVLTSDGHLEITGSGAMDDYWSYGGREAPWSFSFTKKHTTSVSLPDGLTYIGENAFFGAKITQIDIPDSVTDIGSSAFSDCLYLVSIDIPKKVTKLNSATFYHCYALKSISFGGVTWLDGAVFWECTGLTSITIPAQITKMGQAFRGCENLASIYIMNPNCEIESNGNSLGTKGFTVVYGYAGSTAEAFANEWGYTFKTIS